MAVFGIVMVCTGNICRSPLAELLLRSRLQGVPGVDVASAGTYARDDLRMPEQMTKLARELGVDPDRHRPALLNADYIEAADLSLAMARDHRAFIVKEWPQTLRRTFTIREFARITNELTDNDLLSLAGSSPYQRLEALVSTVAERRGGGGALGEPKRDDIADPYGRDETSYKTASMEIAEAVDQTARTIEAVATRRPRVLRSDWITGRSLDET